MPPSDPTEPPADVPEEGIDELYGLPLDEFTPRRDALARELRSDGKRDAADWVKALRKPSAAAWTVNQLTRARTRETQELLRAADALRSAQQRLLEGKAVADELRKASEVQAEAARALLADAGGFLDEDGHSPSRATLEKVAQTIRSVALNEKARAAFANGRLTRELSASGFGTTGAAPAPRTRADESTATEKAELKKARAARDKHAQAVKAAKRELAAAEREAERTMQRLDRARADVAEAQSRVDEAESRIAALEGTRGRRRKR